MKLLPGVDVVLTEVALPFLNFFPIVNYGPHQPNLLGFTDYQSYQYSALLKQVFLLHFRHAAASSMRFSVSPSILCWLGLNKVGCNENMRD